MDGRLHQVQTVDSSISVVRVVYVSAAIKAFLDGTEARAGRLHADLDRFIEGRILTASLIPRKAGNANMGLLSPTKYGIWDTRSQDPRPSLRLLGGFASKDVFVGLVLRERRLLGDWLSRAWANAVTECRKEWRDRFVAFEPIKGDSVHDYLSNCRCVDSDS
jgi:hypothetical protein